MSDLSRTKKSRVRRNVAALVSAVALATGGVAVPQVAGAYTPVPNDDSGQPRGISDNTASQQYVKGRNGDGPWVVLGVDINVGGVRAQEALNNGNQPNWPEPGESFNYYIYPQPGAPRPVTGEAQPGQSNIEYTSVTIFIPPEAPLLRAPRPDDFVWVDEATGEEVPSRGFAGIGSVTLGEFVGNQNRTEVLRRLNLPERISDETQILEIEFSEIPSGIKLDHAELPAMVHPNYRPQPNSGIEYFALADVGIKPFGEWSEPYDVEFNPIEGQPNRMRVTGYYELNGGGNAGYTYPFVVPGQELTRAELEALQSDPQTAPGTLQYVGDGGPTLTSQGYGQWMLELWTGSNLPFVRLVGDPQVTFTLPGGEVITMQQLAQQGYVHTSDPRNTEFTDFEGAQKYRGTYWDSVYHWDFNESNGGRLWLPDGTTVRIQQDVENVSGVPINWEDSFQHTAFFTSAYNRIVEENSAGAGLDAGRKTPVRMGFLVEDPSGTHDRPEIVDNSVGDRVWVDKNVNGVQDPDETEGVANVVVTATAVDGSDTRRTATAQDGSWRIYGLKPGTEYTIDFELPAPSYLQPDRFYETKHSGKADGEDDSNGNGTTVRLTEGEHNNTYDFGVTRRAAIGDRVWIDADFDGIQDPSEITGVEGVKVTAKVKNTNGVEVPEDQLTRTATTNGEGNWAIYDLYPGVDYEVTFAQPDSYAITRSTQGDDRAADSNELTTDVRLNSGEVNDTIDLGLVEFASVGDEIWFDADGEGDQDPEELPDNPGSPESLRTFDEIKVTAKVVEDNGIKVPQDQREITVNPSSNKWSIGNLYPGVEYEISFSNIPEGYEPTQSGVGDEAKDSNGLTSRVILKPGQNNSTYDLGLIEETTTPPSSTPTVTTPTPTTAESTPCDCTPTTVTSKVTTAVPTTVKETETKEVLTTVNGEPTTVTETKEVEVTKEVPATLTETSVVTEPAATETVRVTNNVEVPTTITQTQVKEVPTTVNQPTTVITTVEKPAATTTINGNATTIVETSTKEIPTTVQVPTTVTNTTTVRETIDEDDAVIIGDKVFIDANGNGKQDPGEDEGVGGITITITNTETGNVVRTVTDKDGNWKAIGKPGKYEVSFETGRRVSSNPDLITRTFEFKPGEKRDDIDLPVLPSGSVGDRVWNDEDGDGEQGENEKGLENVVVLVSREGEPTRSAVTDENGDWKIEGLNPNAEYEIRFIEPEGWEVTGKVPGSDESGLVSKVTVKPNEYNETYDLGLKKIDPDCDCEPEEPGRIGDRVWVDENGDGKQDPGEKTGVPDVTVIVRDKDGNEVTRTVTDENGNWKVDVAPGDYEVEYRPRDWKPTDPSQVIRKITVEAGKEYLDLDLGVKPGEPAPSTPPVTVTQTVEKPAPSTTPKPWSPGLGEGGEFLDRCVANAVRSPFLYLVPVALLGAFGGELARPYMGAINEQVNRINAEFQAAIRRDTPEWGEGGQGVRREDPFAELRGQFDAANRQLQQIAADPDVQRFGTAAAGIIGLIAAGAVIYDWCSSEEGQAVTAIKGGGSSRKEAVTTVAPTVTTTETRN